MQRAGSGGRRGASDCQFKEECLRNGRRNAAEIGSGEDSKRAVPRAAALYNAARFCIKLINYSPSLP